VEILIDNGVVSRSSILEGAVRSQRLQWGNSVADVPIAGFARTRPHDDADYQREIDALFTVGRLAR
jgi:hypothetical protein